jgi:small-conductance mechanosensitive channel
MPEFIESLPRALRLPLVPISLIGAGLLLGLILRGLLELISRKSRTPVGARIAHYVAAPAVLLVPLAAAGISLRIVSLPEAIRRTLGHLLEVGLILAIAWTLLRLLAAIEEALLEQYHAEDTDNLKARKVQTQVRFMRRLGSIIVLVVSAGVVLLTFEDVRQLGTTLLASAGIVGVVLGFAAQRTLGTLLSGLQVAFTQPIRLDDVLICENEWGRVEEITLTYVVLRIWDQRRLVLPMSYFIDRPFQNWTRVSAELLGTVYLYLDYRAPIDEIREAYREIITAEPLWDGRVWNLQVTDATEKSVELRFMLSAKDSPTLWDLRVSVREKLVELVQERWPESLPLIRAELRELGGGDES